MKKSHNPPYEKLILATKENRKCGVVRTRATDPLIRGSLELLKIEVALGVSNFWKARGLTEPLSPSFKEPFTF